jgi:streptomycin 3"-adenylyltransferase
MVVRLIQATLAPSLQGAYLYGSAAMGGLKLASDLDVFVVTRGRTSADQRRSLIDGLRPLSARTLRPSHWRPVELTIVVGSEVRPWRYPPRMDFQSGEWLRAEFDAGSLGVQDAANPDLALLISMVLDANRPLFGPRPAQFLDAVPHEDVVRAMLDGIEGLMADIHSDTANVLLTLVRIWNTIQTGTFVPKDAAADWARERLPPERRGVLEHARQIYMGVEPDLWDGMNDVARFVADYLVQEIKEIAPVASPRY